MKVGAVFSSDMWAPHKAANIIAEDPSSVKRTSALNPKGCSEEWGKHVAGETDAKMTSRVMEYFQDSIKPTLNNL